MLLKLALTLGGLKGWKMSSTMTMFGSHGRAWSCMLDGSTGDEH
jgi:hypothetical protein